MTARTATTSRQVIGHPVTASLVAAHPRALARVSASVPARLRAAAALAALCCLLGACSRLSPSPSSAQGDSGSGRDTNMPAAPGTGRHSSGCFLSRSRGILFGSAR
jgi:hypothetical protein